MDRHISNSLLEWKSLPTRRPLLVRGARQIGKSYSIREFGKRAFENVLEVNLEERKELRSVFESNDPKLILSTLALQYNQAIEPGKSLLFIDEIQESSAAFLALRYFFEKMPELHVVAAGSLLDIALAKDKELRVPVGRIEFRHMLPLNFMEFLSAMGEAIAQNFIKTLQLGQHVPEEIHQRLLTLFGQYILCGGMPAVVSAFANSQIDLRYRKLQADILRTYKEDFRKYRSRIEYDKLEFAFDALPRFACKEFKYNEFCPDFSQVTTRNILKLFEQAHVINSITATHANGIPLHAESHSKGYKYAFLDTGLYNSFSGLSAQEVQRWNHDLVNAGALAEQVVAQELLAYADQTFEPQLFYWRRNTKGSSAEVDYVVAMGAAILPLEVKSGSTGRLLSLRMFLQEKQAPFGIRVSQHPLSYVDKILSVPLYALSRVAELSRDVLAGF